MNSNFEKLHDFLLNCSNSVNKFCVTETWFKSKDFKDNSNFHLPNFGFIHQESKIYKKGGEILIYLKNDIKLKILKDLFISDNDNELLLLKYNN